VHPRKIDIDLLRGFLRKIGYAKDRSSYPLISGDTYAALSDTTFRDQSDLATLALKTESQKIFLPAYLKDSFLSSLRASKADFHQHQLIIHNYDNIPTPDEFEYLSSCFSRVYSVNWLGDHEICTPIPIGIENWDLLRNGVPRDFISEISSGIPDFSSRSIQLLASFSLHTNFGERSKAINFVKRQKNVFQMESFSSPAKYRELLRRSQFVLSPPGNGADCHRTWEALYMGAIPIVLEKYWPFQEIDLPVLVVADWEDVPERVQSFKPAPQLTVDNLKDTFLTFRDS
jgi:hypothetical protein